MSEANYPEDLHYYEQHDWVRVDGDIAEFGVTWHAQDSLGDIVFYAPPEEGATLTAGDSYGELESVKAVSDVIAPLDGEVIEINDEVVESPEKVNEDPYSAWLIKVKLKDLAQVEELLSAAQYKDLIS